MLKVIIIKPTKQTTKERLNTQVMIYSFVFILSKRVKHTFNKTLMKGPIINSDKTTYVAEQNQTRKKIER